MRKENTKREHKITEHPNDTVAENILLQGFFSYLEK